MFPLLSDPLMFWIDGSKEESELEGDGSTHTGSVECGDDILGQMLQSLRL